MKLAQYTITALLILLTVSCNTEDTIRQTSFTVTANDNANPDTLQLGTDSTLTIAWIAREGDEPLVLLHVEPAALFQGTSTTNGITLSPMESSYVPSIQGSNTYVDGITFPLSDLQTDTMIDGRDTTIVDTLTFSFNLELGPTTAPFIGRDSILRSFVLVP